MRRLPALMIALLVIVVATTATAAGAIGWAIRDDDSRAGPGMMGRGPGDGSGAWGDSRDSRMGWPGEDGEPAYLAEMIAHHQEAIEAARELERSDRPEMRKFGQSIVDSQSVQVEQMEGWLDEWYADETPDVDYRPMMRDLAGLSGDRLDQAFLQDMIGHHMMAVMMSQHLLWSGTDHDEVAELARSIRDEQRAEIVQMRRWLAQWFDADWRGGMGGGMCSGDGLGWGMGPGTSWGSGR